MMNPIAPPLIAVDIGNSRTKLGLFETLDPTSAAGVPCPSQSAELPPVGWKSAAQRWLAGLPATPCTWAIATVVRGAETTLQEFLTEYRPDDSVWIATASGLPLVVDVAHPKRVGIDRLLAAVAANALRDPTRAAIAVDLGSAITVDLVTEDGTFRGGAILPGIGMSARALNQQTDQLPLDAMRRLESPPPALGKSTTEAIQSGLYWGAVGAIRELISRLTADLALPADVFLTGGAAPAVAQLLGPRVQHVPALVLSGLALAAAGSVVE